MLEADPTTSLYPANAVTEAAQDWQRKFNTNKGDYPDDVSEWLPAPIRREDVLPELPQDNFIRALGIAAANNCYFLVELVDVDGKKRQKYIDSYSTYEGIRTSLNLDTANITQAA